MEFIAYCTEGENQSSRMAIFCNTAQLKKSNYITQGHLYNVFL